MEARWKKWASEDGQRQIREWVYNGLSDKEIAEKIHSEGNSNRMAPREKPC